MITIQSGMLVALGFLAASLLALLIAPLFWARAVRLTSRRIKDSMPISEIEIRADKDRIRAEYAIKVHKLESEIEQVRLSTARQQIEINRRDASVNELESELEQLRSNHEEALNARRVLEQTISDRLPRVEERLSDAKKLLFSRDREVSELTRTGERQAQALDEAKAFGGQQRSEVERLTASLAARARRAESAADAKFDGETALRSELDLLRAKTRDQAQLLARMQSMVGRPVAIPSVETGSGEDRAALALSGDNDRQLRVFKARNDDQASEIARLKAALAVFENGMDSDGKTSLRESRIGLKARLQSLEAQSEQQSETIQKLRGELAAANERLARQANHFTNELKRLGGGQGHNAGASRRPTEAARLSLTERVSQGRAVPENASSNVESLPLQLAAKPNGAAATAAGTAAPPAAIADIAPLAGAQALSEAAAALAEASGASLDVDATKTGPAMGDNRPRLLDRIASLGRT